MREGCNDYYARVKNQNVKLERGFIMKRNVYFTMNEIKSVLRETFVDYVMSNVSDNLDTEKAKLLNEVKTFTNMLEQKFEDVEVCKKNERRDNFKKRSIEGINIDRDEIYNVKQVSEILNINQETVRRWYRRGKLVAHQDYRKSGLEILGKDLIDAIT